jgi:hypothetical protein
MLACMVIAQTSEARKIQGFEAGDPATTSTGDAGTQGVYQGQAPPEGSFQFLITTIRTGDNEDGAAPQSGNSAVTNATLSTFFNGISLLGVDGSGILIPFTIQAGDTSLTFRYDFLSNEPAQTTARNDFAFEALFSGTTLVGTVNTFAQVTGTSFSLFGAQSPFIFHTGYQTFTMSLVGLAPGSYSLGIGVEDRTNADHASGLLIDNFQVNIPEPSTIGLGFAGAVLLVALRSRIKRKS